MRKRSQPSARRGITSRRSSVSPPSRASSTSGPTVPDLKRLEKLLKVRFRNKKLLTQAVTHSSYAHEHPDAAGGDNERLEFLGDAVIEIVAAELLYRDLPEAGEGVLTLERAAMVSTGALAAAARRIDLGHYLRVGRGVEASGGRQLDSLLANAVEALIGAIYLDRGLKAATKAFATIAAEPAAGAANFKGILQERSQADNQGVPKYEVIEASGPGHRRHYRVEVRLGDQTLGVGEGSTRRAAEQGAAEMAIDKFKPPAAPGPSQGSAEPVRRRTKTQDMVSRRT